MNFKQVKSIKIPEGVVKTLSINGQVVWSNKPKWPITYTEPFHFITKGANKVRLVREPSSKTYVTLEYSTDNVNWKPWGSTESGTLEMSMAPNSKLYLRGNNPRMGDDDMWYGANRFESDDVIDSAGDISSLVDVNNLKPQVFAGMFHQFKNLKSAPRLNIPVLPQSCYDNTFKDSGIRSINLTLIHELDSRGLCGICDGCIDLQDKNVKYPTDLIIKGGEGLFASFSNSGVTIPFDFSYNTSESYGSAYMGAFRNTKIKSVKINTKVWNAGQYTECFQDCRELSLIDFSSVDTVNLADNNWVLDVAPKGIFIKKASVELPVGPHGIPEGWKVMTPEEYEASQKRFHFKNVSDTPNTVKLTKSDPKNSPTVRLEKSSDGLNYTPCDIYTGIELQPNETVYLRGKNNTISTVQYNNRFSMTGAVECHGSIMDLCDGGTDTKVLTQRGQFANVFWGCTNLTTAPELPATTLTDECYYQMFHRCSFVEPPVLPATTLKTNCYGGMFDDCNSLVRTPELPATTLTDECYYEMFAGCDKLTTISKIAATTTASKCCYMMFAGSQSLVTGPELFISSLDHEMCLMKMFYNCKNLNYVKVNSERWDRTRATDWLGLVAATGNIDAPYLDGSSVPNSADGCPTGWTMNGKPWFEPGAGANPGGGFNPGGGLIKPDQGGGSQPEYGGGDSGGDPWGNNW